MTSKKAQGISINVIIVAVIALLVLVVLMAIFGGRMGLWGEGVTDAQNRRCSDVSGYDVVQEGQQCPDGTALSLYAYTDVSAGFKCCLPIEPVG